MDQISLITRQDVVAFRRWLKEKRTSLTESVGPEAAVEELMSLVDGLNAEAKRLNPSSPTWRTIQNRIQDICGVVSEMNASAAGDCSSSVGKRDEIDTAVERLVPFASRGDVSLKPEGEKILVESRGGSSMKAAIVPLDAKNAAYMVYCEGSDPRSGCVVVGPKKAIDVARGILEGSVPVKADSDVTMRLLRESIDAIPDRISELKRGETYRFIEDHFQPQFRGREFTVLETNREEGHLLLEIGGHEVVFLAHEANEYVHGGQDGSFSMIESIAIEVDDEMNVSVSGAKSVSLRDGDDAEKRVGDGPSDPPVEAEEVEPSEAESEDGEEKQGAKLSQIELPVL